MEEDDDDDLYDLPVEEHEMEGRSPRSTKKTTTTTTTYSFDEGDGAAFDQLAFPLIDGGYRDRTCVAPFRYCEIHQELTQR